MTTLICEGSCENHEGEVLRVRVTGSADWGEWHYCQTAIAEDRRRGFDVEIIDPNPERPDHDPR